MFRKNTWCQSKYEMHGYWSMKIQASWRFERRCQEFYPVNYWGSKKQPITDISTKIGLVKLRIYLDHYAKYSHENPFFFPSWTLMVAILKNLISQSEMSHIFKTVRLNIQQYSWKFKKCVCPQPHPVKWLVLNKNFRPYYIHLNVPIYRGQ